MKGIVDERFPVRPEYRDYQLAKTFGWTRQQIDEQPAVWLDWLLMIDLKAKEIQADEDRGSYNQREGFGFL